MMATGSPARRALATLVVLAAMRTERTPGSAPVGPLGVGAESWSDVHAGVHFACARTDLGRVKCWGMATWAQLGTGDAAARGDSAGELGGALPFIDFGTGRTATQVSAGGYHSCALLSDSSLTWCVRAAQRHAAQRVSGTAGGAVRPAWWRGQPPSHPRDGAAADALPRAPRASHTARPRLRAPARARACSWGQGSDGRIGTGNENHIGDNPGEMGDALVAVNLGSGLTASDFSCGRRMTCAIITGSNRIKCFGVNDQANLGLGDMVARKLTAQLGDALPYVDLGIDSGTSAPHVVQKVSCRFYHTCAITAKGLKWCARTLLLLLLRVCEHGPRRHAIDGGCRRAARCSRRPSLPRVRAFVLPHCCTAALPCCPPALAPTRRGSSGTGTRPRAGARARTWATTCPSCSWAWPRPTCSTSLSPRNIRVC